MPLARRSLRLDGARAEALLSLPVAPLALGADALRLRSRARFSRAANQRLLRAIMNEKYSEALGLQPC